MKLLEPKNEETDKDRVGETHETKEQNIELEQEKMKLKEIKKSNKQNWNR